MPNPENIPEAFTPQVCREMSDNLLEFVGVVKRLDGVNRVILHGSSVFGGYRRDSDWDLGIITNGLSSRDIDRLLRERDISEEQVGSLRVHGMVFSQEEVEIFIREGRVTGHPGKYRLMSNMLHYGRQL